MAAIFKLSLQIDGKEVSQEIPLVLLWICDGPFFVMESICLGSIGIPLVPLELEIGPSSVMESVCLGISMAGNVLVKGMSCR